MTHFYTAKPLALSALLSLMACQTSRPQTFQFDTRITNEGYKLFQLAYPQMHTELRLPNASASTNHRRRPQYITEKRLRAVLEEKLIENGYCRQGYVLLGRAGGDTSNRLRGECRDKANARDRQTYPDSIERW